MNRTLSLLLSVVVTAVAASAAGQDAKYRAPRTESGQPDLQGVWNFNSGVPLQRPAALASRTSLTKAEFDQRRASVRNGFATILKFAPVEDVGLDWSDTTPLVEDLRTSLITYPENGRLPPLVPGVRRMPGVEDILAALGDGKGGPPPALQALIAAFSGGKKDSYTDFSLSERCLLGPDVPYVPQLDGNYVQIIQAGSHAALVTDFSRRVIALDGRPSISETLRSWSGVSRGHWEGETLVVETKNFSGRAPGFAGAGTSGDMVVTERFTLRSSTVMDYAVTVVNPKVFQDRIQFSLPMARVDGHIHEGACHEGNYSMRNALSAARVADQATTTK